MRILFSYTSGEQGIMQSVSKVKSFFAAHRAARVLLVIAIALSIVAGMLWHPKPATTGEKA